MGRRIWTKEKILEEIIAAYERGDDLSTAGMTRNSNRPENRRIYDGAKRIYGQGSWEDVLKDAGLDPDSIVKKKLRSKEQIRQAILERKEAGLPLNHKSLEETLEDRKMLRSAIYRFGSWDKALSYAGINPETIRKRRPAPSKTDIIKAIITMHIAGKDLNVTRLKRSRGKNIRRLVFQSKHHFHSWEEAVTTAGIDYEQYKRKRPAGSWSRETVISDILALLKADKPLNTTSIMESDCKLYAAACVYIGSWKEAIEAAGLDYSTIKNRCLSLTKNDLIARIQELYHEGEDLSVVGMDSNEDPAIRTIYTQADRKFKGWAKAVQAAGLDYDKIRRKRKQYTSKELTEFFRKLHAQGKSLRPTDLGADRTTKNHYKAVTNQYDSFYNFLKKIGIDPEQYQVSRAWTDESIIQELRDTYDSGIVRGIRQKRPKLYHAINNHYGDIQIAIDKAGLVYFRKGTSLKELIESDPKTIGRLYNRNKNYLNNIAKKVFYSSRTTLTLTDFEQEAFMLFCQHLPELPYHAELRPFMYKRILYGLKDIVKKEPKHVLIGEDRILDFFSESYGHLEI